MTPEQFCYWLQGRLELNSDPLTPEETQCVREHLKAVFMKVTPPGPGEKRSFPNYPVPLPTYPIGNGPSDYPPGPVVFC